jgi:regulatory protein
MRARRGAAEVNAEDPAACREAALKLLERQRRTRADLSRRLHEKGYAAATIEPVLDRLAGVGLIDDVEYARAFIAGRWGRRAAGWRRIALELRARGVTGEDIATARARLEEREGNVDEVAGARRAIAQAARRYARLDPRVRRQRLYALLARRGFDCDVIARALEDDAGE